jgi:hypothetical protein
MVIGGKSTRSTSVSGIADVWAIPCDDLRNERWFRLPTDLPYGTYSMSATIVDCI